MRINSTLILVSVLSLVLAACGDDDNGSKSNSSPTPTVSATSAVATATSVPPATNTSAPTSTRTAQPTAVPTAVPTGTPTLAPTDTPTAAPTDTPSLLDELEASGVGKYIGAIAPSSNEPNGVWTKYLYDQTAEQAICLRGGQYQVNVHPGTTNKVLLYLEGGGACWNNESCWTQPSAKIEATPYFGSGILLLDNPDNPFRDWNVVYVPYCDGSVFAGDNVVDYEGGRTYHHGLQNLSAAVTLMREQFPDPELVVVSGSSAGGYGTFAGYGVTRVAYPEAPILVLNDSGPGVQNPESVQDIEDRQTNWKINESIPASCTRCPEQYSYLTEWALQRDPTLRYGLFSNLRDVIIRSFNDLDGAGFEALLRQVTGDIQGRNPERYKRFFVQGESHTILLFPQYYSVAIDGTKLRDWTVDFLTDGPAWQDLIEAETPADGAGGG